MCVQAEDSKSASATKHNLGEETQHEKESAFRRRDAAGDVDYHTRLGAGRGELQLGRRPHDGEPGGVREPQTGQGRVAVYAASIIHLGGQEGRDPLSEVREHHQRSDVQWCFSWYTGLGGGGGGFDHFLDPDYTINVNPNVHTVVPQLRVNLPSPAPYVDMLTPTLEVIDFLPTFNVTSFANNPHLTLLPIRE
jgi:hypothetical protein